MAKLSDEVENILIDTMKKEERVLKMMREVKEFIRIQVSPQNKMAPFEKEYPEWKRPLNG